MFTDNVKVQTHFQHIRENISSDVKTRQQLVWYGSAALIYCLLNVYLGLRIWQAFGQQINLAVYIFVLAGIALILPIAAYLLDQGRDARAIPKIIAYAGFYWTGFLLYSVLLMGLMDFFRILNRLSHILPAESPVNFRTAVFLVIALTFVILAIGTLLARRPRITGYLLQVDKTLARTRPLRIALLSDIHYGSLVSTANLSILCRKVREQQPDLILLAGDLIDNSLQLIRQTEFAAQMSSLRAPLGVYAVLGNHELVNADAQETVSFYRSAGIRVLQDETLILNDQLILAGRNERQTDYSSRLTQQAPDCLLADADHALPIVLMQHQPADLDQLNAAGVDIAVAGHTHRGQLFPLNILNRRHFQQSRRFQCLGNLQSIISSGYGTWGPPIRLGSRSEIVIIDLIGRRAVR